MKTKFICVKPKSRKAQNRFANMMNGLHSCKVEQETEEKLFLASITGKYFFWISKGDDEHWTCKKSTLAIKR